MAEINKTKAKSIELTVKTQDGRYYFHDRYYGFPCDLIALVESNIDNVCYAYQRGFLSIIVDSEYFQSVVELYRIFNNEYF